MPVVPADTDDIRALATGLIETVDDNGVATPIGTVVHLGAGVYLTAAHVLYDFSSPQFPRPATHYQITMAAGLDAETTYLVPRIPPPPGQAPSIDVFTPGGGYGNTFHHFGWGTPGATDIAVIFAPDVGAPAMNLWVRAQPEHPYSNVLAFGYPTEPRLDGPDLVETNGQILGTPSGPGPGAYLDVETPDGPVSVLVSEPGMPFLTGQDGSGVFGDFAGEARLRVATWLLGIATIDATTPGSDAATGIEPVTEIYVELARLLESRGIDADVVAVPYVDYFNMLDPSTAIPLTGTYLNEIIDGRQGPATIDGGGGDDMIFTADEAEVVYDGDGDDTVSGWAGALYGGDGDDSIFGTSASLFGGDGRDTLHGFGGSRIEDGAGVDLLHGEPAQPAFNSINPNPDTFVLVADGRPDDIRVFDKDHDRIDISAWGVTSFDQLSISDHRSGRVYLEFGKERLLIDDGARNLTAADLSPDDFILRSQPDPIVIHGTEGSDKLHGTQYADLIFDFGGIDALSGRGGADQFFFSADGAVDYIKDYEDGLDLIDLSGWEPSGFQDLTITTLQAGKVLVSAGDEQLVVMDAARALTAADLTEVDFNLTGQGTFM